MLETWCGVYPTSTIKDNSGHDLGYTLLRGIIGDPENISGNAKLKIALVNIDDAWLFSFFVEELPDGVLAVFVPSAPTPTAGNVYMMTEQQARRLDVPVAAATKLHHAASAGM